MSTATDWNIVVAALSGAGMAVGFLLIFRTILDISRNPRGYQPTGNKGAGTPPKSE